SEAQHDPIGPQNEAVSSQRSLAPADQRSLGPKQWRKEAAMNAQELRARTIAAVRRHPSRTHRVFRVHMILGLTSSVAISLAIFLLAGGLRAAPRPESLLVGTMVGTLTVAVLAVLVGIHRGRSMLPRPRWQLALLVALVPAALFAWKVAWSARYPGMMVD